MTSPSEHQPQINRAFVIRGKRDGQIVEMPLLEPAADEVRVKVAYVGICGSDLHYYFEGANGSFAIKEPLIPGHEISGRIDVERDSDRCQGACSGADDGQWLQHRGY